MKRKLLLNWHKFWSSYHWKRWFIAFEDGTDEWGIYHHQKYAHYHDRKIKRLT